jgi:hypothetical protein
MRFAGRALDYLVRTAKPEGRMGMALEYGGNALGALMTGAMFGGGDLGRSVAIGAEDLGIGLLGSISGRAAGDLVARKLLKIRDPGKLQMAQLAGSMPMEMGLAMLSPRPILDRVMAEQERRPGASAANGPQPRPETQAMPSPAQQVAADGDPLTMELRRIMGDLVASQPREVRDVLSQSMGLG